MSCFSAEYNQTTELLYEEWKSLNYMKKNNGPNAVPCVTPQALGKANGDPLEVRFRICKIWELVLFYLHSFNLIKVIRVSIEYSKKNLKQNRNFHLNE